MKVSLAVSILLSSFWAHALDYGYNWARGDSPQYYTHTAKDADGNTVQRRFCSILAFMPSPLTNPVEASTSLFCKIELCPKPGETPKEYDSKKAAACAKNELSPEVRAMKAGFMDGSTVEESIAAYEGRNGSGSAAAECPPAKPCDCSVCSKTRTPRSGGRGKRGGNP